MKRFNEKIKKSIFAVVFFMFFSFLKSSEINNNNKQGLDDLNNKIKLLIEKIEKEKKEFIENATKVAKKLDDLEKTKAESTKRIEELNKTIQDLEVEKMKLDAEVNISGENDSKISFVNATGNLKDSLLEFKDLNSNFIKEEKDLNLKIEELSKKIEELNNYENSDKEEIKVLNEKKKEVEAKVNKISEALDKKNLEVQQQLEFFRTKASENQIDENEIKQIAGIDFKSPEGILQSISAIAKKISEKSNKALELKKQEYESRISKKKLELENAEKEKISQNEKLEALRKEVKETEEKNKIELEKLTNENKLLEQQKIESERKKTEIEKQIAEEDLKVKQKLEDSKKNVILELDTLLNDKFNFMDIDLKVEQQNNNNNNQS
jgi:hypothetical protein